MAKKIIIRWLSILFRSQVSKGNLVHNSNSTTLNSDFQIPGNVFFVIIDHISRAFSKHRFGDCAFFVSQFSSDDFRRPSFTFFPIQWAD